MLVRGYLIHDVVQVEDEGQDDAQLAERQDGPADHVELEAPAAAVRADQAGNGGREPEDSKDQQPAVSVGCAGLIVNGWGWDQAPSCLDASMLRFENSSKHIPYSSADGGPESLAYQNNPKYPTTNTAPRTQAWPCAVGR